MSRCFPYPPAGYVSNRATGDALIESIKIKRDKEKVKQETKEQKRRDKEERKKEKKEKKKEMEKLKSIQNSEGSNKRKRNRDGLDKSVDTSWVNSKAVHPQKKNETEAEQLERSSLSEEHEQPVLTLSYSSDGTHSNTKRIRIEQPPSNRNCSVQGKSVRFRLKRREHENAHPTDDLSSTSGRTSTPVTKMCDGHLLKEEPCLDSPIPTAVKDTKGTIPIPVEQLALTTTRAVHGNTLPICISSAKKSQKKPKSTYEALFSNWVPPPIHFEAVTGDDDDQWMFTCKKQAGQNKASLESLHVVSDPQCFSLWPRAHLLPEADYILPFTVPL